MMLTDAGSDEPVRIILETLLQLFNNFQCHTQIDLRNQTCHKLVQKLSVLKPLNHISSPELCTVTLMSSKEYFILCSSVVFQFHFEE